MAAKRKSTSQVDKEIHIRRLGGKVAGPPGASRKIPVKRPAARSAAEVDKDVLRRTMGVTTPARGKLSDASTGRLKGTKFDPRKHHRDLIGRFD
jgi:hypothetical protein